MATLDDFDIDKILADFEANELEGKGKFKKKREILISRAFELQEELFENPSEELASIIEEATAFTLKKHLPLQQRRENLHKQAHKIALTLVHQMFKLNANGHKNELTKALEEELRAIEETGFRFPIWFKFKGAKAPGDILAEALQDLKIRDLAQAIVKQGLVVPVVIAIEEARSAEEG